MDGGNLIYLVWNDFVGLSRTRGMVRENYEFNKARGLGWALAGQSLTPFEDIAPNPWGPMDEVRQTPDPDTEVNIKITDGAPALSMVLCDSRHPDGTPWECCTRSLLKAALDELERAHGLILKIAYENEFKLYAPDGAWNAPFSLAAARSYAPFIEVLTQALLTAQVGLETVEPEYGVGQYEISCGPAPGVAGADRVVITREVLREAARQCGLHASLSPKTGPDDVGNGCHLHLSLWHRDGTPASFDPEGPGELSPVAAHFVAGVHRHLQALMAFTAPSPVSYLRLGPHHWSCGYDAVGVQNREAAIRICPAPAGEAAQRAAGLNIEYRATDATASPYLSLAAILRAGLHGLREKLPLPALLDQDPADLSDGEREKRGIRSLPGSLETALSALDDDPLVKQWFSPTMLQAYKDLKTYEAGMFKDASPDHLCERYRLAY